MGVAGGGTTIVASGYSGEFFAYLFCGKKVGPCRGSDGEDEQWQKNDEDPIALLNKEALYTKPIKMIIFTWLK
ncbi:hypothetical protein G5B30_02470 [Sphingobacterium sp. SGG-5]|uniref:hypothetical protein n=1 Tax=Sphingobacterium sp. SGG-5 TaxID=2710881 RepID=UPI0013EA9981|nr:hypothetical protein [Sphingobacterium sp. SGG-5]NGM60774.1 hypothetical protein [Sphingobacterium sp. SGG-5]